MNADLYYLHGVVLDANTQAHAVATSAYTFTLAARQWYMVTSTTLCHIRMGTAATGQDATAAASTILPPNVPMLFRTDSTNTFLSIIRNAADGIATVTKMAPGV
jgi:hypothetical protein